ncbi:hypothetical protein I302_101505 [Kwoniella bestiolae CBS 10118]|uniref:MAGE domain-containing protein n=1 Tax=Kwoniella bestiolae CBS 10118 TaxID=1296100 RepID=A0AAJ8K202_9TREE
MGPKRPNTYASQGPSQRRRTQAALSDSDSDEDGGYQVNGRVNGNRDEEDEEGGAPSTQAGAGGLQDSEIRLRSGQLARYALFQEYKKSLIRRADIVKNVLPNNPRAYNLVFEGAQKILRESVGCELVEVRGRGKGAIADGEAPPAGGKKGKGKARPNGNQEEDEDDDNAAAPTQTQKGKSASTKAYILRSILPPDLQAAMSNPLSLPLGLEDEGQEGQDSGALIQWEKGDGTSSGHIALLGIRTVILAIVMTMGRVVSDDILHAYLRRLNLRRETILPYSSTDSKEPRLTLDKYLDLLARQNYLEKVKIPGHGAEGGESYEWRWGQREVEFSEKDAARFIEVAMLGENDESSSEEEEEEGNNRRRGGREKVDKPARRKKLGDDVVRAAGGELTGKDW